MARRPQGGVGEYVEAGADPCGDLLDGVPANSSGGQFDGERNAFEAAADLGGGHGFPGCVEGDVGVRGTGPVLEESECVGRPFDRQRCHLDELLALDVEGLSAGGEHGEAGRRGEDLPEQMAAGGAQMFAGVEDEQQLFVGEPFAQGVDGHAQGVVREPDGVGHGRDERPVALERGEIRPPDSVAMDGCGLPGGADRESGLADAAGADECGQPAGTKRVFEPGEFRRASDEARRLLGNVSHHGHRHCHCPARGTIQTSAGGVPGRPAPSARTAGAG